MCARIPLSCFWTSFDTDGNIVDGRRRRRQWTSRFSDCGAGDVRRPLTARRAAWRCLLHYGLFAECRRHRRCSQHLGPLHGNVLVLGRKGEQLGPLLFVGSVAPDHDDEFLGRFSDSARHMSQQNGREEEPATVVVLLADENVAVAPSAWRIVTNQQLHARAHLLSAGVYQMHVEHVPGAYVPIGVHFDSRDGHHARRISSPGHVDLSRCLVFHPSPLILHFSPCRLQQLFVLLHELRRIVGRAGRIESLEPLDRPTSKAVLTIIVFVKYLSLTSGLLSKNATSTSSPS